MRHSNQRGFQPAERLNRHGQVTAEMAVLFTFVIAALVFMGTYIQRGSQGSVKGNVDSMGQQFSTTHAWQSVSHSKQAQNNAEVNSGQCSDYEHDTDKTSKFGADTATCTAPEDGRVPNFKDPGGNFF